MRHIINKISAALLCILLIIPAVTTVSAAYSSEPAVKSVSSDIYSYMTDRLMTYSSEINLASFRIAVDDFPAVFDRLIKSTPELFQVQKFYSYSVSNGYIMGLRPKYRTDMSLTQYSSALEFYRAEIDKIAAKAEVWMSDLEKVAVIHDYIVTHFDYDTSLKINDAYSMLRNGHGVCQAYSLLFTGVMRKVGIGVDYATSEAKNHMWNVVELDGEWYHIDTTWDDPLMNAGGDGRYGYTDHTYMLKSDAFILRDSEHGADTESARTCGSAKYDSYFWDSIITCFVAANRDIYCFNSDTKAIDKCDLAAQTIVPVYTLDARWTTSSGSYRRAFSSIASYCDRLYFNSPDAILRYDPMTDSVLTEYEPDLTDGWIYGFAGTDNVISYYNSWAPYDSSNGIKTYTIAEQTFLLGDVDSDGYVNMLDIFKLRRHLALGGVINKNCADMNSDGLLNTSDSLALRMYLEG